MTTTQAMRPPRATRRLNTPAIAIVGTLHLIVIYGLYLGLTHHFTITSTPPPITIVKVKDPAQPTPQPQQPTVTLINPTGQVPKKPVIVIDQDTKDTGPSTYQGPTSGTYTPPKPVIVDARGITSTHTIPNYPPIAVRLNETGNVKLRLSIDPQGNVVGADVVTSSGYDALDRAAMAWVISHWRYQPATQDGKPFATSTDAVVTFRLTGG